MGFLSGRSELVNLHPATRRGLFVLLPVAAFLALGSQVPHFLDPSNLLNVVRQSSITGICAVGMTFVIVIKGIDLSLAGLLAFCPMISGILMLAGFDLPASMAVGMLAGILLGLFNGLMVSKLAVPAFITTLVVGQISQGLALTMNGGSSIGGFPERFVFIGNGALAGVPFPTCCCWLSSRSAFSFSASRRSATTSMRSAATKPYCARRA